MATVHTSVESARGCGYRKGGGIYLVSGGLSEPCPKLPIELHSCPTCSLDIALFMFIVCAIAYLCEPIKVGGR